MANPNKKVPKDVTLPYDFIPFPNKYFYYEDSLPDHDKKDHLNGYIQYRLVPHSDLAVEVKEGKEGCFFLSGSLMRGKVRANLEILSQSYPQFINCTPMLFRSIAGDLKDSYRRKMGIGNGIEKSIRVGFLKKDGNDFYVIPAKKYFGEKYFESIKEHKLINMGLESGKNFCLLYDKNKYKKKFEEINNLQKKIDQTSERIKTLRIELKDDIVTINEQISKLFIGDFSFHTKINKIINKLRYERLETIKNEIETVKENLIMDLKKLRARDNKLDEYFINMANRWMKKNLFY